MAQEWKVRGMEQNDKNYCQHTLQLIWAIGLMESWFCIWEYLANPKIRLNLVPNPL
jgi:hypothetical protein